MASGLNNRIDDWLEAGGRVLAASDRAAHALRQQYDRARLAEGLEAWATPRIDTWNSFVQEQWRRHTDDGSLVLNALQEQSLWAEIIAGQAQAATALSASRNRMARLAMDAHALLVNYAWNALDERRRVDWQLDAGAFSQWLSAFDHRCAELRMLPSSRVALRVLETFTEEEQTRPALLLVGFDRVLPLQRALLTRWGTWQQVEVTPRATDKSYWVAADEDSERAACAAWCRQKLLDDPEARLLIITQNARSERGALERVLLEATGPETQFEFSLGTALAEVPLMAAARLLLRWLCYALDEHQLDWLLGSGFLTVDAEERDALGQLMLRARRNGTQRPRWSLDEVLAAGEKSVTLTRWRERLIEARRMQQELDRRGATPLEWSETAPKLLETAGWPGMFPQRTAGHQVLRRWQFALEQIGSLGFDGRRWRYQDLVTAIDRAVHETLYAPESRQLPILIAGPTESAGLEADGIWFLGAHEDNWPALGTMHPLLPNPLQREHGMPHSSAHVDGQLCSAVTARLLASAPEFHASHARQIESAEARPSPLLLQLLGKQREVQRQQTTVQRDQTMRVEDRTAVPFTANRAAGGSMLLTDQSQCPARAFLRHRVGAEGWERAEFGLDARQRGQLLHAALQSLWSGPPDGFSTQAELLACRDLAATIGRHVGRAMEEALAPEVRRRMPARYLDLERQRLIRLVTEWMKFEQRRVAFRVMATEAARNVQVQGLELSLRMDRIDQLVDGSLLILDYKTGQVSSRHWSPPRPKDVQLPLYATHALTEEIGGLAYVCLRADQQALEGMICDAQTTIDETLSGRTNLVRNPLTADQLDEWRLLIEELAADYLRGEASVDPAIPEDTCMHCVLASACRIGEQTAEMDKMEEEEDD